MEQGKIISNVIKNSDKGIQFENHLSKLLQENINEDLTFVIIFCPKLQICSLIKDYIKDDLLDLLSYHQKYNYLIVLINNDDSLYKTVLESKFSNNILSDLSKITDITIDYCFSPVKELLFFNFSLIETCDLNDFIKFNSQMYFVENGLYIVNKKGFYNIFGIIVTNFHFEMTDEESFFSSLTQFLSNEPKVKNLRKTSSATDLNHISSIECERIGIYRKEIPREPRFKKEKEFYTDKLIYCLLIVSLEKLENFSDLVTKELSNLYDLYLKLPLKERKAFYKRLHLTEVAIQMIHREIRMKRKFIDFIHSHGTLYRKLTENQFSQNKFDLLLDLIMSKITQLEFAFERYECTITLIKDNFHIIIEDNENQGNITFNNTMKLLTILSTLYTPFNIITGLLAMNVQVPFQADLHPNFNAFFGVIFLTILIDGILLYIFKRNNWI